MNDFISAPAGTPDVDNEIQFLKGREEFFKALIKDYQTLVDTSTFFEAHPIYLGKIMLIVIRFLAQKMA